MYFLVCFLIDVYSGKSRKSEINVWNSRTLRLWDSCILGLYNSGMLRTSWAPQPLRALTLWGGSSSSSSSSSESNNSSSSSSNSRISNSSSRSSNNNISCTSMTPMALMAPVAHGDYYPDGSHGLYGLPLWL